MATMAIKLTAVAAHRKAQGLNQEAFWTPMGVTQSAGSRYENGRDIPGPVALLLLLRTRGAVSDKQMELANKELAKQHRRTRTALSVRSTQ